MSLRFSPAPLSLATTWLLLAAAACSADPVVAQDPDPLESHEPADATGESPLADRFHRADRVFAGTVLGTAVEQRDVGHAVPLPHTHVTFRVDRAWKGATTGEEVTLRFLGGPADDGRTLKAEGVPDFRVGDRDLLFAREGDLPCPLVDEDRGRLRLEDGGARTDAGTPLPFDALRELEDLAAGSSASDSRSNP